MSRILLLIREGKEHIPDIGISGYKGKVVLVCGPACLKVGQLGQGDGGFKLPALQPNFYFVSFLLTIHCADLLSITATHQVVPHGLCISSCTLLFPPFSSNVSSSEGIPCPL